MSDGFLAVMWTLLALVVVYLIWIVTTASIMKDCRSLGQFRVEDAVFECKERLKSAISPL